MNPIKKLAGQTAIYGVGTILGRILNYLLTPLYTAIFTTEVFGLYSVAYAYIAILLVVLTYGMETALFHFTQKERDKQLVLSTATISILFTTTAFWAFVFLFSGELAGLLRYPHHPEYVQWLGLIIGLDALSSIPMAWLRQTNRPRYFTFITLVNIAVNIGLNVFFLVYCRGEYMRTDGEPNALVSLVYNHDIGVGYIFIANLIASLIKTMLCLPVLSGIQLRLDKALLNKMLRYSWPLIIAGLGFIINERLDLLLLERLLPLPEAEARSQVGIYSGCYKLAILMSIFIQAYRFAAEPFFFAQQHEKDARTLYARIMNYFVVFCCLLFLMVNLYMDVFKHFIRNPEFWEGLKIVPIIMMANLFLGIYVNLSMWYKLSGHTLFGAWFSVIGAVITIALNIILIPILGYMGSAWATFIAYLCMMLISYFTGQRYYKIPYNWRKILLYLGLAVVLYYLSTVFPWESTAYKLVFNTLFFVPFLYVVWVLEPTLQKIVKSKLMRNGSKG